MWAFSFSNLTWPETSGQARREGGLKGSLSGGSGTQGGPGFRIVRFRIQNSSAQTTACGRDDVFFLISGGNSNICGLYDLILLITRCWAEIWTSAEAMTLFLLITWFWAEIRTSADALTIFLLITWFWGTTDQKAQTKFLPRGPKFLSAPLHRVLNLGTTLADL